MAESEKRGDERRGRAALLFAVVALVFPIACSRSGPPNLILLIGDDHGFRDFGFMGSPVARTPNLDALAAGGTVFDHGFATASSCRLSLQTLLTGLEPIQYRARTDALLEQGRAETLDEVTARFETLPRHLGRFGFASFQGGKHWEGHYRSAGYDEGLTLRYFQGSIAIGRETMDPVYDFIDRHTARPFFVWFAPMIPHVPHDAPERFWRLYEGVDLGDNSAAYLASVSWFDSLVGELVDFIEQRGLRDRTLFVYVADNGWDDVGAESDGPRGKHTLYETGFRTPIIFNWPGHVPSGVVKHALVSTSDIVPTVYDYLGVPSVPGLPGENLRPAIASDVDIGRSAIIGSMRDPRTQRPAGSGAGPEVGFFLRTPEWHYIWYPRHGERLYDMASDPGQESDVSSGHPDLCAQFRVRIERWRRQLVRSGKIPADAAEPAAP